MAISNTCGIVYTPLHGTGNKFVREGLQAIGFNQVEVVKEQEQSDPNFSSVKSQIQRNMPHLNWLFNMEKIVTQTFY